MKKLIALLLVICMVAGLFVACKSKKPADEVKDPTNASNATEATTAPEATEAPDATEAPEATGETEATEATGETEATEATGETEATEAPEETKAPEETGATKNTKPTTAKPTAAVKPTAGNKVTSSTKATKATTATKATAATKAPTKATNPVATTKATTATKATTPANSAQPYKGKTLQIYGMGDADSYTDFSQFTEKFLWMQKAAAVEWAEANGVTLEFKGSFDQNAMISDINAGGTPDLFFQANFFPGLANVGLAAEFTDAEYKKLADICGKEWLDMMKYGTKSVGFVVPWTGTMMCYYNKTMFDDYGVKTPREYFEEGNWTWETFMEVMEAMTKDVDSDGTIDTYGLNGDSWGNMINPWATNEKGELISTIDEPWVKDFFQLKYDAYTVKKVTKAGKMSIQTNVIFPMFAMQFSDCEPYNFEHLYQSIPNGDELEVAPMPEWRGPNGESLGTSKVTQQAFHMAASCDEREATVDLLAYILKCGLKYVADYSLGTVKCEYEGLKGTSQLSANYLNAFNKMNARRKKDLAKIDTYDAEYVAKMNEYLNKRSRYIYGTYTGVKILTGYSEITQMPPESAIPAIKTKYQNSLNTYNQIYISKK